MPRNRKRKSFSHLHSHFDIGSLLDGHMRPIEGLTAAKALGMTSLGMTDHGFCHGHYQFWADAAKLEMKPILGVEAYVAPSGPDGEPSDRTVKRPIKWRKTAQMSKDSGAPEGGKDVAGAGKYTHQTLIARNAVGLRNLWRITSEASRTGIYGKQSNPRADHGLIRQFSEGLIATTGCPSGEIATRIRLGQMPLAYAAVERDLDIYGRDNYFLEVMDHGIDVERQVREGLIDLMRRYRLRPLATNDAHYATPANSRGHDALICVQTGSSLNDPTRFRFDGDSYSIRPAEEMRALFDGGVFDGACDNTLLVEEMVESYDDCFNPRNRMPVFPVPDGMDSYQYLWHLVRAGLAKRYRGDLLAAAEERVAYEMSQIRIEGKHDFTDYLLVLWDLCTFMRDRGILFGARGSAAGSAVLYALEVTPIDPIARGLAFERFINPARVSPPDVDIDIADDRRDEVVAYVERRYGSDHVAANITFGYIGGKAAIKDATRILDEPVSAGVALSKAYPAPLFGKSMWLADRHDPEHPRNKDGAPWAELEELLADSPSTAQIISVAESIERRVRNTSEHACAVIVSSEPLWGVVPLEFIKDTGGRKHVCFEYKHIEAMGLQKLDALGLRNWRIVARALDWVFRNHGVQIDIDDESFDDPEVYRLLAKGATLGVFQLESGGMQKLLRAMKPTSYDDIMAVLALYRPGPMGEGSHEAYARRKNGYEQVTPIHPELAEALEPVLAPTYGLIVFQEQVMAAVQVVAGFSLGRADLLRKAMGKKDKSYMDNERVEYHRGAQERGYSIEAADALWRTIEPFADYAFNKSHTASYGRLSYWSAWLKAHYPVEFMAATLDAEAGDKDKLSIYLAECRRMGITVTVPDINESESEFTPTLDGRIRFGLSGIRGVGSGAAEAVLTGRKHGGPYRDFVDFLERAGVMACTKVAIEGLAEAGAFDQIEPNRRVMYLAAPHAAKAAATAKKRQQKTGEVDLFTAATLGLDAAPDQITLTGLTIERSHQPFERVEQLDRERARLGLYLSGHPLDRAQATLAAARTDSTAELLMREAKEWDKAVLSGMIMNVDIKHRKIDGAPFAAVTLEDLEGSVEIMFFAKVYDLVKEALVVGNVVAVQATTLVKLVGGGDDQVDDGSDPDAAVRVPEYEVTYMAKDIRRLELIDPDDPITVYLRTDRTTKDMVQQLRLACEQNPGEQMFAFQAVDARWNRLTWTSPPMRVDVGSPRFQSEVKALIGRSAFVLTPETAARRAH